MLKQLGLALGCVALVLGATLTQAAQNVRVRGTIESVQGGVLTMKSRTGETVRLHLADKFAVRYVVKKSLADIKANTYIGAAALPLPDGRLQALEVLIFPEAARGTAEGHFPWDLEPESTMTNATVAQTVSKVDGPELTLTYKGGEKKLLVPPDAPIVTFENGDAGLLAAGTYAVAFGTQGDDGKVTIRAVYVSHNGVKPPM